MKHISLVQRSSLPKLLVDVLGSKTNTNLRGFLDKDLKMEAKDYF